MEAAVLVSLCLTDVQIHFLCKLPPPAPSFLLCFCF